MSIWLGLGHYRSGASGASGPSTRRAAVGVPVKVLPIAAGAPPVDPVAPAGGVVVVGRRRGRGRQRRRGGVGGSRRGRRRRRRRPVAGSWPWESSASARVGAVVGGAVVVSRWRRRLRRGRQHRRVGLGLSLAAGGSGRSGGRGGRRGGGVLGGRRIGRVARGLVGRRLGLRVRLGGGPGAPAGLAVAFGGARLRRLGHVGSPCSRSVEPARGRGVTGAVVDDGRGGGITAWWGPAASLSAGPAAGTTSTAPAVTSAAAARPAAALVAIAPIPADTNPPRAPIAAVAPAPAAAVDRPRPAWPAAPGGASRPTPAPAEWPRCDDRELAQEHERRRSAAARPAPCWSRLSWPRKVDAALAGAQVAADQRAGPAAQALGDLAELDPDLVAGQQPRLGGLGERDPRADEQRLDARDGRLHRLGDLLVGERVHLAQHERGPLGLGQLVDVADEQPELLALVDLVGGGGAVVGQVDVHRVDADGLDPAQVVEAAVARDPVQPRPHVDRPVVGEDRVERGGENLLQDVLGVLARASRWRQNDSRREW